MGTGVPEEGSLESVVEEFKRRLQQGESPRVEEYVQRHPQWARRLRKILGLLHRQFEARVAGAITTKPREESSVPNRIGDYKVIRVLGRGGMGIVYEAEKESGGGRVALKVLLGYARLESARKTRFLREAKAAARLRHPNIVRVLGVGESEGLPFYVMQLVDGRSFDDLLAEWWVPPVREEKLRDPRHWRWVARVGAQVADALHHAHQRGVLHRDVKPANLMLDQAGTVWLTDFGLAKATGESTLTATSDVLGTPMYMAPEMLEAGADARTDVYSLGVTMYEMLTLSAPFEDAPVIKMLQQLESRELVPPRQLNPDLPVELETILLKATAREPESRYQSARELAEDLWRFLEDRPVVARRVSLLGRGWRWCRRNAVVAALSAAVGVLLVAVVSLAVWLLAQREEPAVPSVQEPDGVYRDGRPPPRRGHPDHRFPDGPFGKGKKGKKDHPDWGGGRDF